MTSNSLLKIAGTYWHSLSNSWARYRRRQAEIAELEALGMSELHRMGHDTGVSSADLLALSKHNSDSADLLYRRLALYGTERNSIETAVMRDMQRCCTLCKSKTQCAHELEDKSKSAAWPKYCPNEQTLAALGSPRA